jgi:quercetin dioxygenase-like cupin family protein
MTTIPISEASKNALVTEEHTYLRTHRINGPGLRFRLFAEDAALREQASLSTSGRAGRTLVKEGSLRITQIALRKGASLGSHQVAGGMSLHVLRGQLRLATSEGDVTLEQGDLAALDFEVFHAGVAMNDCVVLVTIAMRDAHATS